MNRQPILNACGQEITPQDRHVPLKEVCLTLGVTRNTIDAMIARGQFPTKHHTTPSRVCIWQSELDQWHKLGAYGWQERYGQAQQQRA